MAENKSFFDFGLDPSVEDGLEVMNFIKPSPVQEAAIPPILAGDDVIACAQTGTGKTAAFLLPILSELSTGEYPDDYVNVVIMSPTRELALQIEKQVDAFSYFVGVSALSIYGGTGGVEWEQQKRALKMGADIIVATPGRLLAHINMNSVDLSRVSFFVLDEADRMLDMGFYDDIVEIYKLLPGDVQTVMFSATMPDKIRRLAKAITRNPVEVNIAISRPPESIEQSSYFVQDGEKMGLLTTILNNLKPQKCIVFLGSKESVKQARRSLTTQGHKVREMHSDLSQGEREEVMRDFKSGGIHIIVATDIISRGIDVDDIELVINYDVPADPEDYVHRIGRTSRGDNQHGFAITLVSTGRDTIRFRDIERFLGYKIKQHELPSGFHAQGETNMPKNGRYDSPNGRNNGRNKRSSNDRNTKQKSTDNSSTPKRNSRKKSWRRKKTSTPVPKILPAPTNKE